MKTSIKTLAIIASVGMFLVLVMGATVTNTESEQGCGHTWPLCRGQFIPQFAVATAIEYAHRADAAVETILILALAAGALYLYRQRREIRILVPLMVGFLFVQAGLGAWAVAYPQMAVAIALHFGVSLIAFASVLLTTIFLFEAEGREEVRDRPIPTSFSRGVWGVTAFSYVVVYLGAFVRHSHADLACSGWPLCNGSILPMANGSVAANFVHRLAAGCLALAIVGLVIASHRLRVARPDLYRASLIALAMVALQALSGAVVVFTRLDLFSALAHAATAGLLFGSLAYLCLHVLPRSARRLERVQRGIVPQAAADPAGIPR
jgi:heme a synthase